jgi:CHASE1-domain containing sensor protein
MKALGIEKVETARASLNQGALTQAAFRPGRAAVPATGAAPLPAKEPVKAPGEAAAPMAQ